MASARTARGRRSTAVSARVAQRSRDVRLKRDATNWLAVGIVVAAGVCAFWNSLGGPFIWDDQTAILTNATIRHLWPPPWPPGETPVAGRPVPNLSLAINYAFGGLDVTGYHVFNLGVHVLCALVLFGIVRRSIVRLKPDAMGGRGSADTTALVVALLWMLHPLQTEAVDYVTERTESMMGLFFFLTLYGAIRARHSVHAGRWTIGSIAACAMGVATKESMAVAPFVVLLYDRVFEFGSIREAIEARKLLYSGLAATWGELGAMAFFTRRSTVGASAMVGPWTYLLNQSEIVTRYLGLALWPRDLVLDYGLPRQIAFLEVAPQMIFLGAIVAGTLVALARWPAIGFLGATFFLTLAPTSSLVPIVSEVGAERRMYVPLAALSLLVVSAGRACVARLGAKSPACARSIPIAGAAIVVAALGGLTARTVVRNHEYWSPMTLWQTAVERRPHGRVRMSYATELVSAGRHDEALGQLRLAVLDFPDARYALGTELAAEGKLGDAERELQAFISIHPTRIDRMPARLLLGQVCLAQGRLTEAEQQFRWVLDQSGGNALARQGLADLETAHRERAEAALKSRRVAEAEAQAREALRLDPRDAAAHNLLGASLATQGALDNAILEFQQALQLNPSDQQARANLTHASTLARAARRAPKP